MLKFSYFKKIRISEKKKVQKANAKIKSCLASSKIGKTGFCKL